MILLVNQHTVPGVIDVANAFADGGHETWLFTGYIEIGKVPVSSKVRIIKSRAYNRTSKLSRFTSWLLFTVHYFFYLLFSKRPAAILVATNPPIAPFITALVTRLRRIPFYINVLDLYPDVLQQAGLSTDQGWIYKRWQSNNRWTFAKADGLITLSESMKRAVAKYVSPEKVHIIFNWADTEYIQPIDRTQNPFIAAHHLHDKFVVMYSGNMGLTHDLESLVEAAAILRNEKNIVFIMIGEGGKRKKLEAMKQQKNVDNLWFLPYQDANMFPFAIAAADVGVVTLGTGGEGISVPSKTYVNMAAGLCVIAISPAGSELNRIVETFSIGYVVLPNQPARLADHIRQLASSPGELADFKSRARQASLNFTSANAKQYVTQMLGT